MTNHASIDFGVLGKYYSVRHALRQYTSACVVGSYSCTVPSTDALLSCLELSLQKTIQQHPNLGYNLVRDESHPLAETFTPARGIQQNDVLHLIIAKEKPMLGEKENLQAEDLLRQSLEGSHTAHWTYGKPAWKCFVIFHDSGTKLSVVNGGERDSHIDVIFVAHHAIADGLSGVAFHRALMENMSIVDSHGSKVHWPILLDNELRSPNLPEEFIDLSGTAVQEKCGTTDLAWTGKPVSSEGTGGYKSRVRLVEVSLHSFALILQVCKKHKITITGFIHGLICASLARCLEMDHGFRAITPYSLREHTKTSSREIVNHISYLKTYFPSHKLEPLRKSTPGSKEELQRILDIARQFSMEMSTELRQFPEGSAIARISQISDIWSHCQSQMGRERSETYELSNLGAVDFRQLEGVDNPLKLKRLYFTQCGMVTGPALGFNAVSVRNGPFTVAITWQEGIVEECLVESIASTLEKHLTTTNLH